MLQNDDNMITISRYDFEDIFIYAERYDLDLNKSNLFSILNLLPIYSNRLSMKATHVMISDMKERSHDKYRVNIQPILLCDKILPILVNSENQVDLPESVTVSKIDFETILICAERYAIGRMTYAPHTVCELINHHIKSLSIDMIEGLINDIEFNKDNDCLGSSTIDAPVWIKTLINLKQELQKREI
ncbi:MAG: hypothetical protein M0R51_15320 [Clostridia bacterium]|jgi:hypothetical protein|nr:hypothetical protein [Clostridia bacterium]